MKTNKKIWDYIITIPVTILLLPLMLVIAVWIKLDSPGPIFFRQKRVGIRKEYFEIYKFRTMRTDTPQNMPTHLLKNPEQYITKSGRFLRKTSLDELPQLFNILKGDMSIVGPRPALWNQYDLIEERDRYKANDVLPGLTGWAQIHGRDSISIKEKAALDGYYVERRGFFMDMKCMFMTVSSVLKHEGVVEGGTGADDTEEPILPKVSVVVVTYRRDRELKKALETVGKQTYENMEVVLVDDNGDGYWNSMIQKIADEWKQEFHFPLIYVKNKKNMGSAASRNCGIEAATGEYITFLDDDDEYLPKKVETQVHDMVSKNADYSITDLALYNEQGAFLEKRDRYYLRKDNWDDASELLAYHMMYHMTGTDTLMFRKEYLQKIGGFGSIDVGDEYYLMEAAIEGGGKFCYVPACDVKALVHTKTAGLSSREGKIKGENTLYEHKMQFFPRMKKKYVRQVKMRHYLVLAYAHLRNHEYASFLKEGFKAFVLAPLACIVIVIKSR